MGQSAPPSAQLMLEHLERANLFLIPLDDQRGWYRYHQLFAQVLRERLTTTAGSSVVARLHGRASAWFAERGLSAEAVQHALAARDWERAASLIERHGRFLVVNGHGQTVQRWLADLPAAVVRAHPYLHLIRAVGLFFANELDALDEHLHGVEAQLTAAAADDPARRSLGYATILRASSALFRGDVARCVELARQGLATLPADDSSGRVPASVHVAEAYLLTGDVGPGAGRLLSQAVEAARRSGELTNQFYALVSLAAFRRRQGRLEEAAGHYREAAQLLPDEQGIAALPNGANYFFGLGDLLAERHDPRAEDLLARGRQMVQEQRLAQGESIVQGYMALAGLQQARGEHAAAEATLAELQTVAGRRQLTPRLLVQAEAAAAHLALRRGDLVAAAAWAERSGITENAAPDYPREREQLTFCRVRLAQGRQRPAGPALHVALGLLARLLAAAEACERIDSVIELLVLRALTFDAQGRRADGLRSLERAVQLAGPQGYVRVFVAEGAAAAALLRALRPTSPTSGGTHRDGVEHLLGVFPEPGSDRETAPGTGAQPSGRSLDALTQRELDVLRLLALGYSNQTIARELVLAVGTVKRHINNLFGKLQVESRLQAVARARELNLL